MDVKEISVAPSAWVLPSALLTPERLDAPYYEPKYLRAATKLESLGCKITDFRHICTKLNCGATPKLVAYGNKGIPLIRTSNVRPNLYDSTDALRVPGLSIQKDSNVAIAPFDILYTMSGSVGYAAIYPEGEEIASCSNTIARGRLKNTNDNDPYYVAAFLNASLGRLQSDRLVSGGVLGHVMPSSVKKLRIALPSCRVQQAIGNRLRQAERLRRLTKDAFAAAAATVEPLIDGTFKSSSAPTGDHYHREEILAFQGSKLVAKAFAAFVLPELASSARLDCDYYGPTFVENANRLERCALRLERLGDITAASSDGTHDTIEKLGGYQSSGVRFITSGEVMDGFSPRPLFISEKAHAQNKRSEVLPGDLLMAVRGSSSVGVARVFPDGLGRANINTAVARLRFKSGVDASWVALFLNSRPGRLSTLRIANGVNQLNLSMEETADLKVPLPSLDVQVESGEKLRRAEGFELLAKTALAEAQGAVEALVEGGLDEVKLLEENQEVERWLKQNCDKHSEWRP